MCRYTEFGLQVKDRLVRMGKDQKWLEGRITEETGLFVDNGYLYKILTGRRRAPRVVGAIRQILDLKEV